MNNEHISIIISAISSLLTLSLSHFLAKFSARAETKKELEKNREQWNREDVMQAREAYTSMIRALSAYVNNSGGSTQTIAVTSISAFGIFVKDDAISAILSKLTEAVFDHDKSYVAELLSHLQQQMQNFWNTEQNANHKAKTKN